MVPSVEYHPRMVLLGDDRHLICHIDTSHRGKWQSFMLSRCRQCQQLTSRARQSAAVPFLRPSGVAAALPTAGACCIATALAAAVCAMLWVNITSLANAAVTRSLLLVAPAGKAALCTVAAIGGDATDGRTGLARGFLSSRRLQRSSSMSVTRSNASWLCG